MMFEKAVEFYCPHCDAYLQAPDRRRGFSIRCPHCRNSLTVPYESTAFRVDDDESSFGFNDASGEFEAEGAYQNAVFSGATDEVTVSRVEELPPHRVVGHCRLCQAPLLKTEDFCSECGFHTRRTTLREPQAVDLGAILSTTWDIFTRNFGLWMTVSVLDLILSILSTVFVLFAGVLVVTMAGGKLELITLMFLVTVCVGWVVLFSMFAIGQIRFSLELCREQQPQVRKSLNFEGPVGAMLTGGLVYWLLFPFVIPAIFLWPIGRLITDQNLSPGRATWQALRLTTRHSGVSAALFLIKVGAFFASNVVPIIGVIAITPYFSTLNSVAYLYFIGEFED